MGGCALGFMTEVAICKADDWGFCLTGLGLGVVAWLGG